MAEWQTRRTQNPLPARACGFKSLLRHLFSRGFRSSGDWLLPRTTSCTHSAPINQTWGNGLAVPSEGDGQFQPPDSISIDGVGIRQRSGLRQSHRLPKSSSPIADAGVASTSLLELQDPVRQESPTARTQASSPTLGNREVPLSDWRL